MGAELPHRPEEAARRRSSAAAPGSSTLFDHRLAGLTYPTELGGRGGAAVAWSRSTARRRRTTTSARASSRSTIAMLGPTLMKHGTDEQKRALRAAPALRRGRVLPAVQRAGRRLRPRRPRPAGRCATATSSSSPARRCGTRPRSGATGACCSCAPTPTCPSTTASRSCSSTWTAPASRCARSCRPPARRTSTRCSSSEVRVPVANVLGEIDAGWGAGPDRACRTSRRSSAAATGGSTHDKLRAARRAVRRGRRPGDPPGARRHLHARAAARRHGRAHHGRGAPARGAADRPVDPQAVRRRRTGSTPATWRWRSPGRPALAGDDEVVAAGSSTELIGRYGISIGGGTNEVQRNNLAERALGLPKEIAQRPPDPVEGRAPQLSGVRRVSRRRGGRPTRRGSRRCAGRARAPSTAAPTACRGSRPGWPPSSCPTTRRAPRRGRRRHGTARRPAGHPAC